MGNKPLLITEFDRIDSETGQEVKVQRFAPGRPPPGLITRLTAGISSDCDRCVYNDGTCRTAVETGGDFPCNTEGAEKDFSGGEIFPRGDE